MNMVIDSSPSPGMQAVVRTELHPDGLCRSSSVSALAISWIWNRDVAACSNTTVMIGPSAIRRGRRHGDHLGAEHLPLALVGPQVQADVLSCRGVCHLTRSTWMNICAVANTCSSTK